MDDRKETAHPEALDLMRKYMQMSPHTRWCAYQNMALDSANCGHLQFLAVGPENTFKEPPTQYPMDNEHGMGWRYRFAGWLDLSTGEVKKEIQNGAVTKDTGENEAHEKGAGG